MLCSLSYFKLFVLFYHQQMTIIKLFKTEQTNIKSFLCASSYAACPKGPYLQPGLHIFTGDETMAFHKMLIHIFCLISPILTHMTLDCPILSSYVKNILSLWVFNSLPCSDSKSHSLQEKRILNFMLQVDKISHIINICGLQFTIITLSLLLLVLFSMILKFFDF